MAYASDLFESSRLRAAVATTALLLAGAANAALPPGYVEAQVGAVLTTSNTDFSVTATIGDFTAIASRVDANAYGTSVNSFNDFIHGGVIARAVTVTYFSVAGLVGVVPLTFNWEYSGARIWNVDAASFSVMLTARLSGPGFIDSIRWGISYVDGPPAWGDFAGNLAHEFVPESIGNLGVTFDHVLPVGQWNGQGARMASSTWLAAANGEVAEYVLFAVSSLAGDLVADYRIRLASVTVADASQLLPGAHLQLGNGSQIAITAVVPEPHTWALMMGGLVAVSLLIRRRTPLTTT